MPGRFRIAVVSLLCVLAVGLSASADDVAIEKIPGEGVWTSPRFETFPARVDRFRVTVWFEDQLLGDGKAYLRRAKEFSKWKRRDLRKAAAAAMKQASNASWKTAQESVATLVEEKVLSNVERHWIVNGFSCSVARDSLKSLEKIPGVRKIFCARPEVRGPQARRAAAGKSIAPAEAEAFDPKRYLHPWYIRHLQADRVWRELKVTGEGTLNVIHDFNFVLSRNVTDGLYRNPGETPDNGKDDDGNGLVDDVHGFDFDSKSNQLTRIPVPEGAVNPQLMHGFMCAAIISGRGSGEDRTFEFGIAPRSQWTGVIASMRLEASVEWAVEQGADTYSMSFSMPGLGDYRSHWRKLMEHGSFCGICFVSGAGNFAQQVRVPVQMRTPEDIPDAVFAAAGVQRNFARTPFSSQGPVEWKTEHYQDGTVAKPEVCAFNMDLPMLRLDGTTTPTGLNGNSFAGPMFCGSISLMLSADPDLLPWDLKKIITSTATDVGPDGFDAQTGHGLINCYHAVREVLRRKAIREGGDRAPFTGPEPGDEIDVEKLRQQGQSSRLIVARVQPGTQAAKLGLKARDIIVSYDDQAVSNRADLLKAKAKVTGDDKAVIVVQRGAKKLELTFESGPLGFAPAEAQTFDEPVFK